LRIRDLFKKREDKFLKLLIKQAKAALQGIEALEEFMQNNSEESAKVVNDKEKEADEIRRILIDELLKTFVTPLDREDIFSLSRAIVDATPGFFTDLIHPVLYLNCRF